jgi:hypothetical protein
MDYREKQGIGLRYQELLYKTLVHIFGKMNIRGVGSIERKFVSFFLAVAYFRIPEFQAKMLSSLVPTEHFQIEDWRREFTLEGPIWGGQASHSNLKPNSAQEMFNWDRMFYAYLKSEPIYHKRLADLTAALTDDGWKKRLMKHGYIFFSFFHEWTNYVYKTLVIKDNLPWLELPGYKKLVNIFLEELKNREVTSYSELMITLSSALLQNERLLNIFILILYKKTK